jgi:hypothetical protein
MGYCSQFEDFDPKDGQVPWHPFSVLPYIASRARWLLHKRSSLEIKNAAWSIYAVFDSFFQTKEEEFIEDQLQNNGWVCKYIDEQAPSGRAGLQELIRRGLPESARDDEYLDFLNKENTTELEALKLCIDEGWEFGDEDCQDPQPEELFAVLTLCYIADCLKWLKRNPAKQKGGLSQLIEEKGLHQLYDNAETTISIAGREALMAMDTVCYAEQLRAMSRQDDRHQKLSSELHQHRHRIDELAEQKAAARRSEVAKEAAAKRHEEHAILREEVIRYFEENRSQFKSVEAAARAIAGVLA